MRRLPYLFLLLMCLVGCMSDDKYTTSPNDKLSFSTDSVKFDTIISGEPTKTYSFVVYNNANKSIRISSVGLQNGSSSPFKVNVDGVSMVDGVVSDLEIAKKDSMIVYLMANVPSTDTDAPVYYSDKLNFLTESGILQSVQLTASGQDVINLSATHITSDETYAATRPYRIKDSLVVDQGATLTLAAGTTLMFHSNAQLIVHGKLHIEGTLENPVTLRGDRLDNMFKNQPYDRTPGLWGGIQFTKESYDNQINYADIHSGTYGIRVDSCDISSPTLRIENSVIHTVSNHGLDVRMAQVFVGNSQITNTGGDCVHVRGGDLQFVHCTIGRFYVFTGGYGHALDFANYDGDVRLPLQRLDFSNSIITGYSDDEVMGAKNVEAEEDAFNYSFSYSLLNTPEPKADSEEMSNFSQCLWDQKDDESSDDEEQIIRDKNFTPEFNTSHLLFDFELYSKSKAIGTANVGISQQYYPIDRLGRSRIIAPDMGCYQHEVSQ